MGILGVEPNDVALMALMGLFAWAPWGPIAVFSTVALLVHLFRGKPRWQLFGLYLCCAAVVAGLAVDLVAPQTHRRWRGDERSFNTPLYTWGFIRVRTCAAVVAAATVAVCQTPPALTFWFVTTPRQAGLYPYLVAPGVVLSLILCIIAHAIRMVKTSGPYRVGVVCERVVRESAFLNSNVDFLLRVYYPLASTGGTRIPYLKHGKATARAMANFASLPFFVMDHLRHVEVDVVDFGEDVVPAAAPGLGSHLPRSRLPVIVFSHGLGGVPDIYLSIIQDLASHVRCVVCVAYDWFSALVVLVVTTLLQLLLLSVDVVVKSYVHANVVPRATSSPLLSMLTAVRPSQPW